MKLVTQDGRTFNFPVGAEIHFWAVLPDKGESLIEAFVSGKPALMPADAEKNLPTDPVLRRAAWHKLVDIYAPVGYYKTKTGATTAANTLTEATRNGATEFTVPQDTFKKSAAEHFDDFAKKHHLTLVSINELGYTPSDTARNLRIWLTSNEFERRNIIVADPTGNYDPAAFGGAYSTSLAKWRELQRNLQRETA